MQKTLIWAACAVCLCCSPQEQGSETKSYPDVSVESYQLVDAAGFNETILAAGESESWPADPVEIARRFIGSHDARTVNISRQDDPGERADSTTVIIVEDGYLDDSLRGTWHRFRMARSGDGTWIVAEVRRAYRCWRGHHQNSYSEELCP
jgi:hypothetical protein